MEFLLLETLGKGRGEAPSLLPGCRDTEKPGWMEKVFTVKASLEMITHDWERWGLLERS